jgi:transposase InsO family protein
MPWKEVSAVSLRLEFVRLASQPDANVRELCRRFQVSAKTAYKWLARFRDQGAGGLTDRSRRPARSPRRTADALEQQVLALRAQHPAWGGRKLRARLLALGVADVPAASTLTAILHRHGRIDSEQAAAHRPCRRFEHDAPNRLWQLDFKGHFATDAGRCHPLTIVDDHSRFALGLFACADERTETVRAHLTAVFRRYGLPERILCDNGPPWGSGPDAEHTPLTVWWLRLGIAVSHGRPYHPQTQGKDERFHRTLKAEVLQGAHFRSVGDCQGPFDAWREVYNHQRPHEALALAVPATRYRASGRPFPEELPPLAYEPPTQVRKVQSTGRIHFRGRAVKVGKAFAGYAVGVRPTTAAGLWEVYFGAQRVAVIEEDGADEAAA